MRARAAAFDRKRGKRDFVAVLAVCTSNLLAYFAIGIPMPVLPLHMRTALGSSDVTIGVVMASYAVTTLVGRPVGGRWGDRHGYAVPAIAGALLIVLGTAAYGAVASAAWLLLCRLVVGWGEGMSQACCVTWAVSLVPERRRGAVLSYAGVTGWAGVALGALVGEPVFARTGYRGTLWVACLAPAVGIALLWVVRGTSPPRRGGGGEAAPLGRLAARFLRQGGAYALVTVGYAAVLTFGSLLVATRHGASPSLLLRAFIGGVIAVRVFGADLPVRFGPAKVAAVCAGTQAVGFLAVALTGSVGWLTTAGAALAGASFGLSFPSLALDALGLVSERERGVAIGVVSAFFDVGMAASGLLLGLISERAGYSAVFASSALCAALGAVLAFPRRPKARAAALPQPSPE